MTTREHGTVGRYNHGPGPGNGPGCRCDACGTAKSDYARRVYRHRAYGRWQPRALTDATGTVRRLQALSAVGWSRSRLARRLGMSPRNMSRLIRGSRVRFETARAVRGLYDELWATAPPAGTRGDSISAARARNVAERSGWPPPMAWDDDLIDDPAARPGPGWKRGGRTTRRTTDLAEDARELTGQGYTPKLAAARLGVTDDALQQALRRTKAAA